MMTRKEFWDWMQTCPASEAGLLDDGTYSEQSGWFVAHDNGDDLRIFFYFDEEHDDE